MKKKLEAELISIAHRILQLKNKSDLLQLHKEAQNLYEKLSLLKFVEENFADAKPTIGYAEIEAQIETVFEKDGESEVENAPEDKQKSSKKATESKEEVTAATEETSQEENETAETAESASENKTAETAESADDPASENETAETTESPEEPASEKESEEAPEPAAAATSESEEKPEAAAATSEENITTEIPETPEQPESAAEVSAALEYEAADDNATGTEIPAEDAGVSEAGEKAPKEADFLPSFELAFDKKEDAKETPKEQKQIAFEDFLGHDYNESFFVKAGEATPKKEEAPVEEKEADAPQVSNETDLHVNEAEVVEEKQPEPKEERAEYRPLPASDHFSKSITIGLNDRVGFEKQLFGGSSEDLNRVLSQLNTFDSFQEAQDFIEDMVKPDYNNWEGKDDYAQRFMDIVEKKFS